MSVPVEYSETAEANIEKAYSWLVGYGYAIAERWLTGLQAILAEEAERLASNVGFRRMLVSEPGAWEGREVYCLLYRTTRRGTAWKIYYEFRDMDDDGQPDTLYVVSIRHAASG